MPEISNNSKPFGLALIAIQLAVLVFHFLVLFQVVDFHHVWAGRLQTIEQMLVFESFSIAINAILIWVVLQRLTMLSPIIPNQVLGLILWLFAGLFSLNTFGNFFAQSIWEKVFGSLFTALSAFLCFQLAKHQGNGKSRYS